jgi:hypothetical protein
LDDCHEGNRADAVLAGPFSTRGDLARQCWDQNATRAAITSLGETRTARAIVGLYEFRTLPSSAGCVATVQTGDGTR